MNIYKLGKNNMGEAIGNPDKDFLKEIKSQYLLPMELSSYTWRLSPSAFGDNRLVFENGIQRHMEGEIESTIGIYSGSTGWGWGIKDESHLLHSMLGKKLKANVINYSQPAFGFSDIVHDIRIRGINDELYFHVFQLGVNEFFNITTGDNIFKNPKADKLIQRIGKINSYYYESALGWGELLQKTRERIYQDVKYAAKVIKSFINDRPRISIKKAPLGEKVLVERFNSLIDVIEMDLTKLFPKGNVVIYWEPTIFDKAELNDSELAVLNSTTVNKDDWLIFRKCVENLCDSSNIHTTFSESDILGDFFDYCHPDFITNDVAVNKISDSISRRQEGDLL
jgi:hypothetical protein